MFVSLKEVFVRFFKSFSIRKSLNTYLFFFFVSFALWLLTMLSKTHETTFLIPIKYINSPADLMEIVEPADFFQVRVKATGLSIILFHISNYNFLELDSELANTQPLPNGKRLFWIMDSKRKEITDILGAGIEIMNINPERIVIPFSNKTRKEVPVNLNLNVNLKQGFWLANDVKTHPSKVVIYGNNNLLDSISSISTDFLDLDDVEHDQNHKIKIILPNSLKCEIDSVLVELKVDPFVEDVITQQVEIRNLKQGYSLRIFPRYVNVTLRLSKSKYQLLKTDFVRLYIDASEIEKQKKIPVQYDHLPVNIKVQRIYPNSVEFFLIKE